MLIHTITLAIATIVFLIGCGLLMAPLIRFRRSPDDRAPDQGFQGHTRLEIIWAIIPVGILITLLALTCQTLSISE